MRRVPKRKNWWEWGGERQDKRRALQLRTLTAVLVIITLLGLCVFLYAVGGG